MSINRKILRNIIISAVALALLIGAYIWVTKWQKDVTNPQQEQGQVIQVFAVDSNNITEINIKNSFSQYTLKRKDEGDDVVWHIPEYPDIEFSQAKLQMAVTAFMGVYAIKEVGTDITNLADFGLDNEEKTAIIHTTDGTECTLILGNQLSVDSSYYLMKKGSNTVYTVSSSTASAILKIPNDYRETNRGGVDVATLEELVISKNGEKIIEFKKFSENDEISVIDMVDMKMTYPYEEKIRSDLFETMIQPFSMPIEAIDFVNDDLSKAAEYGLDKGYQIILKDAQRVHTLTLGDIAKDGTVYAMYNDMKNIFTMDPIVLYTIQGIKPFDFVRKFAHIYIIDDVNSVTVTANGKTYTLAVQGDAENRKYSINGKTAGEEAFTKAFQEIIGMSFTGVVGDRSKATDVICEIIFNMKNGKTNKAVYRAYDDRNAMVTRPDGKENIILTKYVTNMINVVDAFANNPNPAQ